MLLYHKITKTASALKRIAVIFEPYSVVAQVRLSALGALHYARLWRAATEQLCSPRWWASSPTRLRCVICAAACFASDGAEGVNPLFSAKKKDTERPKGHSVSLANGCNFDTILYCVFSISAIYRIIFLLSPLSYSLTIYLIFKYWPFCVTTPPWEEVVL